MNTRILPALTSDAVKSFSHCVDHTKRSLTPTPRPSGEGQDQIRISFALASILQPILFVFLIFFPGSYMQMWFHEAGHALVNLTQKVPVTFFYAHPFSFVGFIRPMFNYYSVWQHVSGTVMGILAPLFIFNLLWKHHSFATLPFLMVFPWTAVFHGLGGILDTLGGAETLTILFGSRGLPKIVFYIPDIILAIVGIYFLISLFPLLGLAPRDKKTFFVLPTGMILYSLVGLWVAHLVVPGSPADTQYGLASEVIVSANYRPLFMGAAGVLLAAFYLTFYR